MVTIKRNKWTVMAYLAGDNNLAEEMIYALTCMQSVGSRPPDYEVFALYDAGLGPVTLRIDKRDPEVPQVGLLEMADQSREQEYPERVKQIAQESALAKELLAEMEKLWTGNKPRVSTNLAETLSAIVEDYSDLSQQAKEEYNNAKTNQKAMAEFHMARNGVQAMVAQDKIKPEIPKSVRETLQNFMIKTISEHPAEHYMLVLSGHGCGAMGDFLTGNTRLYGLSIPDLRGTLEAVQSEFRDKTFQVGNNDKKHYLEHGKIDILGLDSCLMGMAEVAYEVRKCADFVVGAEGFEEATGWPYELILTELRNNPSPEQLAKAIVRKYIAFYSDDYTLAGVSTDLSALDLRQGRIDRFAKALSELCQLLIRDLSKKTTRDNLLLAHWEAQGFKFEQHVDAYDFCDLLQERYRRQHAIWKACEAVKKAIAMPGLVLETDYCGPKFQHAHGISIFFPWANITDAAGVREMDHYHFLKFAETKWDEFVKEYHRQTQRHPRQDKRTKPHLSALNRREELFSGMPGKYHVPGSFRYHVPGSFRYHVPGSFRFAAGGSSSFEISKISSMKNPPIIWFSK